MAAEDNLILHRITQVEAAVTNLTTKIMEKLEAIQSQHADFSSKVAVVENRVGRLELDSHETKEELTVVKAEVAAAKEELGNYKLSVAEKYGPSAVVGGGAAVLMELIKFMVTNGSN